MAPPGMEEMTSQLQGMFQNLGGNRSKTRKLKVQEAFRLLTDEEAAKMLDDEELKTQALEAVEQHGIVFLDEIDKVARQSGTQGADVSREGVQRDLLPLVEGSTVSTKYGMVKTDHILFIASGAFNVSKPSDLIPELQGRFPIRVELEVADHRGLCAHPDGARCLADLAVQRAAGHRGGVAAVRRRTVSGVLPRSRITSTRTPRTSARVACIRSWNACWKRFPSRPLTRAAPRSSSTPLTSTTTWLSCRRTRISAVTSCRIQGYPRLPD